MAKTKAKTKGKKPEKIIWIVQFKTPNATGWCALPQFSTKKAANRWAKSYVKGYDDVRILQYSLVAQV